VTAVEVRSLTKTYGGLKAVDDFSLTVEERELVALAGPDGAGKTSLFRAICGLVDFDAGQVSVMGLDVRTDFDRIKPLMGYMPQSFSLYPDLSVEENLNFYAGIFGIDRRQFKERREALYEFSGLGPFAGRRAQDLSGGMKQKLALSCNLIHSPKVLVLDEPTTGVDPLSRRQFWDILKKLRDEGASILISTPYMDELEQAGSNVFMNQGRRLAQGTSRQLVARYEGRIFTIPVVLSSEEMARLGQVSGIKARRFGASLRVYAPSATGSDQVARALSGCGIRTEGLKEIDAELEDVFVQLMGAGPNEVASHG
jgi:ABC-2 type transport system ATP-binding protein